MAKTETGSKKAAPKAKPAAKPADKKVEAKPAAKKPVAKKAAAPKAKPAAKKTAKKAGEEKSGGSDKPAPARPARGGAVQLSTVLHVRLSERTMARLRKKAGAKTVSTWVRELLEAHS